MDFGEEISPLTPINFFQLSVGCHELPKGAVFPSINAKNYAKYLLPDTSELCGDQEFAKIAMGWSKEGIEIFAKVENPTDDTHRKVYYPEVERGDSLEVFIDTRDVKTATFNTRFCHHFFFLPEAIEGRFAGEITKFRTEDVHPLCDPADLKVKVVNQKGCYTLHAFIEANALVGYDPDQFKRFGFTYRMNRGEYTPQHFSIVTDDFQIDQQPSLWASVNLL
jgi:hypothetical protein